MAITYKLIKLNEDGTYLDGQALENYLESVGFTVPVKQPLVVNQVPPSNYQNPGWDSDTFSAYVTAHYMLSNNDTYWDNQQAKVDYERQFQSFAEILTNYYGLYVAKRYKSGSNPDGTPIYSFRMMPLMGSQILTAVKILMGYWQGYPPPEDPIHFIAYECFA